MLRGEKDGLSLAPSSPNLKVLWVDEEAKFNVGAEIIHIFLLFQVIASRPWWKWRFEKGRGKKGVFQITILPLSFSPHTWILPSLFIERTHLIEEGLVVGQTVFDTKCRHLCFEMRTRLDCL